MPGALLRTPAGSRPGRGCRCGRCSVAGPVRSAAAPILYPPAAAPAGRPGWPVPPGAGSCTVTTRSTTRSATATATGRTRRPGAVPTRGDLEHDVRRSERLYCVGMSDPAPQCAHAWQPYGPPPRHHDYLPDVVRCSRCSAFHFKTGQAVPSDLLASVRPYSPPREPGQPTGWTSYGSPG